MMCAEHVLKLGRQRRFFTSILICLALFSWCAAWAQLTTRQAPATETEAETPKDTLGRDTPRGTVLGFLSAARNGNDQIAALYLNTPLRGARAEELARQLAIVLDRRLPPRLNELSDKPEGSLPDQLSPDEDIVGTISTSNGDLDILVERVDRGKAGRVWLFSRKTLESIPRVFRELNTPAVENFLPEFLVKKQLATIPLFQWLALFVGLPLLYFLTGLLGRLLGLGANAMLRNLRKDARLHNLQLLPPPIRLLLLALGIQWLLSKISLSLLSRQFWSTLALVIVIFACAWLLILANGWG